MDMNELAKEIVAWREKKGFITTWDNMLEKLMLVVTEVSEAAQCYRNDDREGFKEETADTFIRLLDICGTLDIDIEKEIEKKMEKNRKRPYRHGKKMGDVVK
jgi:NTP pyrophosphatase (non-canonical NTP hydrolase)